MTKVCALNLRLRSEDSRRIQQGQISATCLIAGVKSLRGTGGHLLDLGNDRSAMMRARDVLLAPRDRLDILLQHRPQDILNIPVIASQQHTGSLHGLGEISEIEINSRKWEVVIGLEATALTIQILNDSIGSSQYTFRMVPKMQIPGSWGIIGGRNQPGFLPLEPKRIVAALNQALGLGLVLFTLEEARQVVKTCGEKLADKGIAWFGIETEILEISISHKERGSRIIWHYNVPGPWDSDADLDGDPLYPRFAFIAGRPKLLA